VVVDNPTVTGEEEQDMAEVSITIPTTDYKDITIIGGHMGGHMVVEVTLDSITTIQLLDIDQKQLSIINWVAAMFIVTPQINNSFHQTYLSLLIILCHHNKTFKTIIRDHKTILLNSIIKLIPITMETPDRLGWWMI